MVDGLSWRAAAPALVAAVAGTGALAASMVLDWRHLEFRQQTPGDLSITLLLDHSAGLASFAYAPVYLIGVLALLALLGVVVARPEDARWLRFVAAGLGLGLVCILLVMIFYVDSSTVVALATDNGFQGTAHMLSGGYWALGAVGALVVGIWVTPPAAPVAEAELEAVPGSELDDHLTVRTADPIDSGDRVEVLGYPREAGSLGR
jgi:hypothetical protein